MNKIEALLADLGPGLKEDLKFYGAASVGAIGGMMAFKAARAALTKPAGVDAANNVTKAGLLINKEGKPVLGAAQDVVLDSAAVLTGIFGGGALIRQGNKLRARGSAFGAPLANVGRGAAISLTAYGLGNLAFRALDKVAPQINAKIGLKLNTLGALPAVQLPSTVVRRAMNGAMPPVQQRRLNGMGVGPQQFNPAAVLTA